MGKNDSFSALAGEVTARCLTAALKASVWLVLRSSGLVRNAFRHHGRRRRFFPIVGIAFGLALGLAVVLGWAGHTGPAALVVLGASIIFVTSCALMDRVYLAQDRSRTLQGYDESLTTGAWWRDA